MQKTDRSCKVTVDCQELLWVMTPIAAAIPDVVSFLEQISTFLGTWVWQVPFSLYHLLKIITSCSASGDANNTPSWYYLNSPAICPNLLLRQIMLVHYIVGITLFEPRELNVAITQDTLCAGVRNKFHI